MIDQNAEKALLEIAEKFEAFSEKFAVAICTSATQAEEKWYTPKQMTLRLLKATAVASPPELTAVCCILHGAIAVLGFKGTIKLAMEMRRKLENGKRKKKNTVSGVREGSGNNSH
jgi:hypothetical protein